MRRMQEGGNWHVQVSRARTGRCIRDLKRVKHELKRYPFALAHGHRFNSLFDCVIHRFDDSIYADHALAVAVPQAEAVADLLEAPSGWGQLRSVRHAAVLWQTPARWERPSIRWACTRPHGPHRCDAG